MQTAFRMASSERKYFSALRMNTERDGSKMVGLLSALRLLRSSTSHSERISLAANQTARDVAWAINPPRKGTGHGVRLTRNGKDSACAWDCLRNCDWHRIFKMESSQAAPRFVDRW